MESFEVDSSKRPMMGGWENGRGEDWRPRWGIDARTQTRSEVRSERSSATRMVALYKPSDFHEAIPEDALPGNSNMVSGPGEV